MILPDTLNELIHNIHKFMKDLKNNCELDSYCHFPLSIFWRDPNSFNLRSLLYMLKKQV